MPDVAAAPAHSPAAEQHKGDRLPAIGEVIRSDNNRAYALKTILGEGEHFL
jgi:hypothetical protein